MLQLILTDQFSLFEFGKASRQQLPDHRKSACRCAEYKRDEKDVEIIRNFELMHRFLLFVVGIL